MNEQTHEEKRAEAIGIIRRVLAGRAPSPAVARHGVMCGETLADYIETGPHWDQAFEYGVRMWSRALYTLMRERKVTPDDECDLWRNIFKPWLVTLVGWGATNELGRAAGEEGYRLLFAQWESSWQKLADRVGSPA